MGMYALTLFATIISFLTCILHLWICVGGSALKQDAGTPYRKRKYKNVLIQFLITVGLFFLCGHYAQGLLL